MAVRSCPLFLLCLITVVTLACNPSAETDGGPDTPPGDDGGAGSSSSGDAGGARDAGGTDAGSRPDAGTPRVDPACQEDGCLRATTHLGNYGRAAILPYLEPGVQIDNGYSVHTIRFATDGRESTATVTIPYDVGLQPPEGGWHVVGNNHGTSGLEDLCAPSMSLSGPGLAGLFGARGLIGVAVDYPGLGTAGLHPYLVSRVEGTSALDALRAATNLALLLEQPVSRRYAMVGLSQGGHATLAAATLHATHAPELDIRAFGAAAPASAWESQWRAGVAIAGGHIAYHAMVVYAWADFYGFDDLPLWADGFADDVDGIMTTQCIYDPNGGATIFSSVPTDPAQVFHAAFLSEYQGGQWQTYTAMRDAFAANAIAPYTQTAPLRIYQGDVDSTVPEAATSEMVAALRAGGVTVDYVVVSGGGHVDVAFGFVAQNQLRTEESVDWLRGQLDAP
ncbi:MAG: lipase family protein [Myxococcota bacterium]